MKNQTRRLVFLSLSLALAMTLSYVEALIPINVGVPGMKVGLPNVIILVILVLFDRKSALSVMLLRILLVSLTFGSFSMMLYSLAGGLLSFAVMASLLKAYPKYMSLVGISIAGGIAHNFGQVLMAMLVLGTSKLMYYMLILVIAGSIAGLVTGVAAAYSIRVLKKTLNIAG